MNKINICLAILFIFISCKKSSNKSIVIDVTRIEKVSYHDFFSSTTIIPLETNSMSFIKKVQKTFYKNHHYYIFDKDLNTLFVFNEDGSYKDKIHRIGKGPGEYTAILDFEINPYTNDIEILTRTSILIYDTLLNFKKTIVFSNKKLPLAHYFKLLSPDTTVFFSYETTENVIYYSRSRKKTLDSYYKRPKFIAKRTSLNTELSPFYQYDHQINMFDASSNKIYSITPQGFALKYSWDFGKQTFDASTDLEDHQSKSYYQRCIDEAYKAFSFWYNIENKKFIITAFRLGKQVDILIYNKESKKYKVINSFKEGGRIPFYPFFEGEDLLVISNPGKIDIPKTVLDENSLKILNSVKITDNPVIIKFHFNESLLK